MKTKFGGAFTPPDDNLLRRVLALEGRNGALQLGLLRAAGLAEAIELGQQLLRLGDVAGHEIGLAEVLARRAVLRVEAQRLVVVAEGGGPAGSGAFGRRV